MKRFLLYHWGIDADESGLTKKVNWKWFAQDVGRWLLFILCMVIIVFGFIYLFILN